MHKNTRSRIYPKYIKPSPRNRIDGKGPRRHLFSPACIKKDKDDNPIKDDQGNNILWCHKGGACAAKFRCFSPERGGIYAWGGKYNPLPEDKNEKQKDEK